MWVLKTSQYKPRQKQGRYIRFIVIDGVQQFSKNVPITYGKTMRHVPYLASSVTLNTVYVSVQRLVPQTAFKPIFCPTIIHNITD